MSAAEWIAEARQVLDSPRRNGKTYVALVALDALEAVLKIVQDQEYKAPGAPDTYDQWHEARSDLADEIERTIETTLRGES